MISLGFHSGVEFRLDEEADVIADLVGGQKLGRSPLQGLEPFTAANKHTEVMHPYRGFFCRLAFKAKIFEAPWRYILGAASVVSDR